MKTHPDDRGFTRYEPEAGEVFTIDGHKLKAQIDESWPRKPYMVCEKCVLGKMNTGDNMKALLCLQVLCAPAERADKKSLVILDA